MFDPAGLSVEELLRSYSAILQELNSRRVIRTFNSPVGDYAEWLAANCLSLTLSCNSEASCDAVSSTGERYQIKSRWLLKPHPSPQLSDFRNLDACGFDYVIAIVFGPLFTVERAYKIKYSVVCQHAAYVRHVNAYRLHLKRAVIASPGAEDITALFSADRHLPDSLVPLLSVDTELSISLRESDGLLSEHRAIAMMRSVGVGFYNDYIALVREAVRDENISQLIGRVTDERSDIGTVDYRIKRMAGAVRQGYAP